MRGGRSASPDFLCSLVAPARFLRLSLTKAAYAVASSAAYRKSGFSAGNLCAGIALWTERHESMNRCTAVEFGLNRERALQDLQPLIHAD
jgi:hypothetical protein